MATKTSTIATVIKHDPARDGVYDITCYLDDETHITRDYTAERSEPDNPSNGGYELYDEDGNFIDGELKFGYLSDVAEEDFEKYLGV